MGADDPIKDRSGARPIKGLDRAFDALLLCGARGRLSAVQTPDAETRCASAAQHGFGASPGTGQTGFCIKERTSGTIPNGLQVRNEPGLFVENRKCIETWTLIVNRCSCDWTLLNIETAHEMVVIEQQEIEELEKALKESMALDNAKNILGELNPEVDGNSVKLRKDISRLNCEGIFPYLQKDYYQGRDQGGEMISRGRLMLLRGGGKKHVTFSESSGSSSEEEDHMQEGKKLLRERRTEQQF
ncbi:hypothetical protein NDU88_005401 [Pleurodeles waltl]|uniref:Uncharacterized protein n=1 Tax=Pleurodeles waltl TaxID=8319 RepID=A0AAV7LP02_PLEWA|nr:hypothetical protein NDU88_005401 [Pleurodeles waltl]